MNQSNQHGTTRKARALTAPAVAPISRAIRAALAVSATMLTLFTPVASWAAGTCTYDTTSNTYACNGDFTQTIPDASFTPPVDLTVVVGDQLPTSVNPVFGQSGIDATWAGEVSVILDAGSSIGTSGADGIHAYSADAATMVANYGSVTTAVTAAGAEALDVGGVHDVTVVNGGDAFASDTSGAYDVITANVFSTGGDIGIDNLATGTLGASAYDGTATALSALAQGDYSSLYISNEGVINADSVYGAANGIVASAVSNGYTTVLNSGRIQASGYSSAFGIDAFGDYSSTVENSGDISASANAAAADAIAYGVSSVSSNLSYLNNDASGSITATAHSQDGNAQAVGAYASGGAVATLHNYGAISASASSDYGDAQAYGTVVEGFAGNGLLINGGDIDANASAGAGATTTVIGALSVAGVASIFNDANINATGTAGDGGTASVTGARAEGDNSAIYTYGDLNATATVVGGTANAIGAYVYGHAGSATFYNAGDIAANAVADTGAASVIGVESVGIYNSYATNKGTISATGAGGQVIAAGLINQSYFTASTTNDGSVSVVADGTLAPYGQYEAVATGIYTFATLYGADVHNSGSVSVTAAATADIDNSAGWLVAKAIGVRAVNPAGYGEALIDNSGNISASAVTGHGYASAWGAIAQSGSYGYGDAEIDNDGSISSSAQSGNGSSVTIGAYIHSGDTATLVNHGDITATSQAGRGVVNVSLASAYATGANVYGFGYGAGGASVSNYGNIEADASIGGGITGSTALQVFGSTTSIYNAQGATILATGEADLFGLGGATAVEAGGVYGIDVVNNGNITAYGRAHAYADGAYTFYGSSGAMGVDAVANYRGNVSVVNNGDILAHAVATHGITFFNAGAGATGVSTYAKYDAIVENSGSISAIADSELGIASAYGVMNRGKYYSHLINDAGASIVASASVGSLLSDQNGGRAFSFGTHSFGNGSSGVTYNAGSIVSHAVVTADGGVNEYQSMASAWGAAVGAYSSMEAGTVINVGDIEAAASADFGYATSFGTYVLSQYDSITSNAGTIQSSATANNGDAFAVGAYAFALHAQYVIDCSSGYCDYANATFVPDAGTASLDNSGQITAVATASGGIGHAYGATVLGAFGSGITNSGHISASVDADDARAVGALTNSAYGYATLQNSGSGSISAIATGDVASASGVFIAGAYGNADNGYLAATVDNQGSILAKATGDTTAAAMGIEAVGWKDGGIQIDNTGTIGAAAYGADATATAVSMDFQGDNALTNSGDITAVATAIGGVGHSYGAKILDASVLGIINSGHISTSVDADDADAVGTLANSTYSYATLQNSGSGSISAIASGKTASASGMSITGAYGNVDNGHLAATVDNHGSILAKATGTTSATAMGIEAVGLNGDGIQIANAGTIGAAAYGVGATATAVSMDSQGSNVLTNTGTISAFGDGTRIAVSSGIGATAAITNDGSITGAILTGALDDSFDNAAGASWHAIGSSDFGDGDDHVVNHGTMFMNDAAIHLGSYVNGNTFDNFGTINVSGANNVIDMDNPFPVSNNGVISFVDGAPDDVLTVVGDFAGEGAINVDVSGLHQTSDRLYVMGNVVDSTRQTINVNLLDAPTAPTVDIPLITASGTLGGSFTLGQLHYPTQGFVSVDFGLKTVDRTVSLAMDVTGLNGTGSLATMVSPGAQSLVNSEIGTWRQRMGVVPEQGQYGLAPWVRAFSDSGDVNPGRSSNFGSGGNGDFHQSNQGLELGLDTRLLDHLSAGVLIGKSDGNQRLTGGAGSDRLDGRTFGLYGTWLAENSFYFDVSQRWTSIRAHLRSATAAPTTDASASAFNVEAGVTAWTMAGIHVVPQLQYTRTRIDSISTLQNQQSDFSDDGGVSSRGRVGVAFDKTIQGAQFSWTPYGSVNALREFDGKYDYAINGGLLGTTSIRGTSAMVELGLGARRGGLSITGGVNWTDGGAMQNVIGGQLVVRYSW